jgi:PAS domain S-box-containing protein
MPQLPLPPGDSTLFELLPIGAYRSSTEGRQLRANLALARMNGYADEAELLAAVKDIGREWYVDPQRRAEFQRLMQRDGQVMDFVSEVYRHRTRERIWIRENAHLLRTGDGTPLCYEGTVEDITAQRHAELALQASERRFRAFTERSQVLTVVCGADGRVQYVSPASRRLLDMEPAALLHSHVFDWLHADDVQRARAELQAVLGFTNDEHETVWRVRHADGGWRHLAVLANNFLSDPAVAGVVLNIRDVSGRTRAEAELRTLNAELEQRVLRRTQELVYARDQAQAASRAKSEFLSRMSHELRTPMHAILGFGQLLKADAALRDKPAAAGHLREILRAGDQLLGLIDQLLDLARIGAGELPPAARALPPQAPAGTVLVIEDNPVNLLLMEAMLGQLTQCRMLGAELPETGLQLALAERPDLILLDIQLPGIDGYEVLRRLRAQPATRHIPVIAISANAMRADIERGRAAGFDDYLTKPIDQPLLLAALRRCLRHD